MDQANRSQGDSRFDNGNVIIIADESGSESANHTLISPGGDHESKWRQKILSIWSWMDPDALNVELINDVLQDVFGALADSWSPILELCEKHVSILEDKGNCSVLNLWSGLS